MINRVLVSIEAVPQDSCLNVGRVMAWPLIAMAGRSFRVINGQAVETKIPVVQKVLFVLLAIALFPVAIVSFSIGLILMRASKSHQELFARYIPIPPQIQERVRLKLEEIARTIPKLPIIGEVRQCLTDLPSLSKEQLKEKLSRFAESLNGLVEPFINCFQQAILFLEGKGLPVLTAIEKDAIKVALDEAVQSLTEQIEETELLFPYLVKEEQKTVCSAVEQEERCLVAIRESLEKGFTSFAAALVKSRLVESSILQGLREQIYPLLQEAFERAPPFQEVQGSVNEDPLDPRS